MGLYAEECASTLSLATSPVTNWAVAVECLLGVLTFYYDGKVASWLYEAVLSAASPPVQLNRTITRHPG